ncbi:MAG TPA: right-handed parallel beta-helix repeat-containing protein [Anaerolineales bacterium]|nr:right-handed parallel beta-helix repeat-containing protein [Anaerolineales bacterium]
MSGKVRTSLFSLTVIAVLILSAIGPTIAYADNGTPPETTAPQTSDGEPEVSDGDANQCDSDKEDGDKEKKKKKRHRNREARECNAAEDASGGGSESGEAEQVAPNGDNAGEGGDTPQLSDNTKPATDKGEPPLLSDLPENTSVTVLNAEGEPQPLATQEAADAIAHTTDPIWCPVGQPPIPGANNCTPSFSSFTELLTFLATPANQAIYTGAGTIFVEQGAYGGGESVIDFNAYNLSNISSSTLTVQGGWDTTPNPVDPNTAGTSDFLGVEIIIGSSANPWGGSLVINNLVLNDPNQTGLTLYSQGDINVSNVVVENSTNGDGAHLNAGGNVTINNSKFLRNQIGMTINAGGNVAIANSEFSNPYNQRRQTTGLEITNGGSVSLFNVLAIGNRRRGVDINAGGRVSIGSSEFSATNGLNGGVFYGFGLRVVTPDAIDLSFVTANNNFLWGADLDAGGDVNISDSIFNANSTESPTFIDDTGLLVTSGGAVTLNRVQANGNRLIGAVIDATGPVNIDSSTFSDNQGLTTTATGTTLHGLGLQVVSLSNILVSGVTASGNGVTGANLIGSGVTVTNSTFSNNASTSTTDLLGNGLLAVGTGNVILFNVTLDGNQLNGATIQTPGNAILDSVTATNNGENGAEVNAACTGVLNGGTYSGNGQYGLFLANPALTITGSPVFGGNGAGDIFPASTTPCTLPFTVGGGTIGGPTAGNNAGPSSNFQQVSYAPGHSGSATSLVSLDSLMFGITREPTTGGFVTSIFVGNYVYVYTIFDNDTDPILDNLQIIALTPAPATEVAMVGP